MAKRRGNGEGSVYRRKDGIWVAQATVGVDPTTGKTTKSKSGRRSVALTDDAVRELKAHRKRQAQEKLS